MRKILRTLAICSSCSNYAWYVKKLANLLKLAVNSCAHLPWIIVDLLLHQMSGPSFHLNSLFSHLLLYLYSHLFHNSILCFTQFFPYNLLTSFQMFSESRFRRYQIFVGFLSRRFKILLALVLHGVHHVLCRNTFIPDFVAELFDRFKHAHYIFDGFN